MFKNGQRLLQFLASATIMYTFRPLGSTVQYNENTKQQVYRSVLSRHISTLPFLVLPHLLHLSHLSSLLLSPTNSSLSLLHFA